MQNLHESPNEVENTVNFFKEKIEYNGICSDMNKRIQELFKKIHKNVDEKYTRGYIREFCNYELSPKELLKKGLVNWMKNIGVRFSKLKADADVVAAKWQHQVDEWLKKNNLTAKQYLDQVSKEKKRPVEANHSQPDPPHMNGAWKANVRNSNSDYKQNSTSSSSYGSPDSQKMHQRNSSVNHQSNNNSLGRKSSSPLHFDNLSSRNSTSSEFNANLSIDTKDVSPSKKFHKSPVKPIDRFSIDMKENMFIAVKTDARVPQKYLSSLLYVCTDVIRLPPKLYPRYLREYQSHIESHELGLKKAAENSFSGDRNKSLEARNQKRSSPSKSQPEAAMKSSKNGLDSRNDRKRKHSESTQSVVKAKEPKLEHRPSRDSKDVPSIDVSRLSPKSKLERKRKHMDISQSAVKAKELLKEHQPLREGKHEPSTSKSEMSESSRNLHASGHDRKSRHENYAPSAAGSKEEKKEEKPFSHGNQGQKGKAPIIPRIQDNFKAREPKEEHSQARPKYKESQQDAQEQNQDGKLKLITRTRPFLKRSEANEEHSHARRFVEDMRMKNQEPQQNAEENKLKMDAKRVCAMAHEARNCDRNNIRQRASEENAMMTVITSSRRERTSVYHGERNVEIRPLKDMCNSLLQKMIKRASDPLKIFQNINPSMKDLERLFQFLGPKNLYRLEEEKKYLQPDTDKMWKVFCERDYRPRLNFKKEKETWRAFYQRCCAESDEKLKNVAASISASKVKPDRQIKFTTVEGPPNNKRHKAEHAAVAKNHVNNSAVKPVPNSCLPSNSRSVPPVTPKAASNHIKPSQRTVKKDAPLMHKAKKTLGQFHRIHRS